MSRPRATTIAARRPPAPVSPLIATPARAKSSPGESRRAGRPRLGEALGTVARARARRRAAPARPRSRGSRRARSRSGCRGSGDREHEQGEAGAAQEQGQPLAALDGIAEEALGHHREGHGAAGEDRLHEGDRRHREGGDVDQPGHRREPPAGGEPGRARQAAGAARAAADVDRRDALAAAVLEERREVGHQGRRPGPGRSRSATEPIAVLGRRAGCLRSMRLRAAATATAEVRQALAIVLLGRSGRAADLELDQAGAAGRRVVDGCRSGRRSSAASAARSRLHVEAEPASPVAQFREGGRAGRRSG